VSGVTKDGRISFSYNGGADVELLNADDLILLKSANPGILTPADAKSTPNREDWVMGTSVQVYSESQERWLPGLIVDITVDEQGEWLVTNYGICPDGTFPFQKELDRWDEERIRSGMSPTKILKKGLERKFVNGSINERRKRAEKTRRKTTRNNPFSGLSAGVPGLTNIAEGEALAANELSKQQYEIGQDVKITWQGKQYTASVTEIRAETASFDKHLHFEELVESITHMRSGYYEIGWDNTGILHIGN